MSGASKIGTVVIVLAISGCAATSGRQEESSPQRLGSPETSASSVASSILNLRLTASSGPDLDDHGTLIEPSGIAINGLGDLYISDKISNTIYKVSAQLLPLGQEGGIGGYAGGFNQPMGMECDAAMNLYVADTGNRRIQVLDRSLRVVRYFESYADEDGEAADFSLPEALSIDYEGNFWVADDDRVLKLDPFFRLIFEVSEKVPGYFILGRVASIDVSRGGIVAISDVDNGRVILISVYGNYVGAFDAGRPSGVAWDAQSLIWVADPEAGRVTAYDMSGQIRFIHQPEASGVRPVGVAFDPGGRMVMIDKGLRRIWLYDVIRSADTSINK